MEKLKIRIPAQVYSRVAGYFAMVSHGDKNGTWNRGKTEEFKERVTYKLPEDLASKEASQPVLLNHGCE